MKKSRKSREQRLFEQAFDKAARMRPGDESPLSEEENQLLLAAIEAYQKRKEAALARFLQLLVDQGVDLPRPRAKLLFKEYWEAGKFR